MGWDFTEGFTKKDVIKERTSPWENESQSVTCLAHAVRGNVLWTVKEVTYKATGQVERYIGCDLMGKERGFGWGYKGMEERMGPAVYSCPLSYFEMVPDPGSYATEWRAKCRAESARKGRKLNIGDKVRLIDGCTFLGELLKEVEVVSLKPLIVRTGFGTTKLPRRLLAQV
jgi:hypothetical protein